MPLRQIATVLIVMIVIVATALFVLQWDGNDEDDATPSTSTSTSTTSTTTQPPTTTTSIPVECGVEPEGGEPEAGEPDEPDVSSTTTTATTTTATTVPDDDPEAPEPLVPTLGRNSSVSTVGLDTVAFGLTVAQAETAAGTRMIPCEPASDCYRVTPADAPEGISFVVDRGTIERVDIVAGPIQTLSNAGIGSTAEELQALYGDKLEEEVLDTSTSDLVLVPTDPNDAQFRVAFTVVDGVVETFRAGRLPIVLEPDPCGT